MRLKRLNVIKNLLVFPPLKAKSIKENSIIQETQLFYKIFSKDLSSSEVFKRLQDAQIFESTFDNYQLGGVPYEPF